MLTIEMLPAHHGDCLWIEYGPEEHPHRVLVDGGPTYAYKMLKERLAQLPPDQRHFELLVITHVDADHIGGILELLLGPAPPVTFGDIWFNGWQHLPGAPAALGPLQGEHLSRRLFERGWDWNTAFGQGAVAVPAAGALPRTTLPGGLQLTLLAPTMTGLSTLIPAWEKAVAQAGLVPGAVPEVQAPDEEQVVEEPGTLGLEVFDPAILVLRPFREDTSVANGSSIALLAEFEGRSILLGGDAFPTVVRQHIQQLRAERGVERLPITAFKIPHHGGRSNLSIDLLNEITCRHYLISTNGKIFRHPHPETLSRIIVHGGADTQLCFNYNSDYNTVCKNEDLRQKFGYATLYPTTGTEGLRLRL